MSQSSGSPHHRPPAVPRGALLRFGALVVLVGTAFVVFRWTPVAEYVSREAILATLGQLREAWWAPLLLVVAYALLCPIGLPATPLMLAGGVIFGPVWGSLYNLVGAFLGAINGFLLARALGTELIHHYLGERLRRIERQISRRGFWAMVGARYLPVPFPALNFAIALTGVPLPPYALASAIGLTPVMVLWTWFWSAFFEAAAGETAGLMARLATAIGLLLAASMLPMVIRGRQRRRRYRAITANRQQRESGADSGDAASQ